MLRAAGTVSAAVLMLAACQAGTAGTSGTIGAGAEATRGPQPGLTARPSQAASFPPGWERIAITPAINAPLANVVWTGTQFLAVERVEGAVIASTDGRTWQEQPRIDDGVLGQLAVGPRGVLGIGSRNAEGVVAIWKSADGVSWTSATDDISLHGRDGTFLTMTGIAGRGGGWLAVGGESLSCTPGACRLVRAVSWTSPDGLTWSRGEDSAAMQRAHMNDVVRTVSGYIAIGSAAADPARADSAIRPAVWMSTDGRSWKRSEALPVVEADADADIELDSVAVIGGRVVAVGHASTQTSASAAGFAWWTDGDTWSSAEIGPFYPSQDIRVAAAMGGFLAMFGTGPDPSCPRSIWRSADGASWSCTGNDPVFADSTVFDAAASPLAEVLVGSGPDGAVVWTSHP